MLKGSRIGAVYGKLRSDGGDTISRVVGSLARAGVPTPEPLAYLADLRMLLQAEGAGVRLADLRATPEYESWMPAAVDALVRLHTAEIADLPRGLALVEIAELRGAADTIAALLPHLREGARSLVRELTAKLFAIDGT